MSTVVSRAAASMAALAVALTTNAAAQDSSENVATERLDEIEVLIVSGSRLPRSVSSFPGSVSMLDAAEIEKQAALSTDIATVLAQTVPGLGTSSNSGSNFDQTLRGRKPAVLIDGIPVSISLRDGGRDLRALDASVIGSVEVIRGSSALYGNGGAGGVINYLTKRPTPGPAQFDASVALSTSLTHFGDSYSPRARFGVSGGGDQADYLFSGSYEQINSFWDADGKRIPPAQHGNGGLPDSDIFSLFGKTGFAIGDGRLELSALYYDQEQDTAYITQNGNMATRTPARAIRGQVDPRAVNEANDNLVAAITYSHPDVLGSQLRLQTFYQEFNQVYSFDRARFGGSQSMISSEKLGLKFDMETPLAFVGPGAFALWGIDVVRDETVQPFLDGRIFVPELDQDSVAGFLQLELPIGDRVVVQGGVRHEEISLDVAGFFALRNQVQVDGGSLDYDETVFNAGVVVNITDALSVFAGFSQGFSVGDIGLAVREARSATTVDQLNPKAQVIDNYEGGLRWSSGGFSSSVAYFQSRSDLGTRYVNDPVNIGNLILLRQPEKIEGVELLMSYDVSDRLRVGGTYTWIEGEFDSNGDDRVDTPLGGDRIPPEKLTAYADFDITPSWNVRLQALYSGSRNEFPGDITSFARGEIHDFLTIDLLTRLEIGPGALSFGVQNLFNEDYFPNSSEMSNRADRLVKAPGTTARMEYAVKF
ncbi:MAG TPA: TonB-dependent receptor [Steroidobacter sp.]|uniref:TonB-dependent receptor n=1 Tax=Steroidobacter sp. TaxID=1978227 RepID=UPI002ED7B4C4